MSQLAIFKNIIGIKIGRGQTEELVNLYRPSGAFVTLFTL